MTNTNGGTTDFYAPQSLQPAAGATQSDLAGIWMHGDGYMAIHIDGFGQIYQLDVGDDFAGEPIPDYVPRTCSTSAAPRSAPAVR